MIPAFLAGWVFASWVPLIGTRTEYQQEGLIWTGYVLAGFIPVYLAGKVAPSRQFPLAIECALLVAAWHITGGVLLISSWRDNTWSGEATAFVIELSYILLTLLTSAWAVWLVRRKRAADPERGSTWARATGLVLPVALLSCIVVEAFIT